MIPLQNAIFLISLAELLERKSGSNYQSVRRVANHILSKMNNFSFRFFLVSITSFLAIITKTSANIEVTFMKKILNKCTRKLQSFEQSDVSLPSKLLAKAIPASNLKGNLLKTKVLG